MTCDLLVGARRSAVAISIFWLTGGTDSPAILVRGETAEVCDATGSGEGCVAASGVAGSLAIHPWPNKGGNANASGFAAHRGVFDVSRPSWVFPTPSVVHTSPVIDVDGNVYITHTGGAVVSLTRLGVPRWSYQTGGRHAGCPALLGKSVFVCAGDGVVVALDTSTGDVKWQTKVGNNCPSDSHSLVATESILVVAVNAGQRYDDGGNCDVAALNPADGSIKWMYILCANGGLPSFNFLPSIVADRVVFHDMAGGVTAVSVAQGERIWHVPPPSATTMSTAAMVTGPNDLVYAAFNYEGDCDDGKGMVRAHDLWDGHVVWSRAFDHGINAGPAVGVLRQGQNSALVVAISDNFCPKLGWRERVLQTPWIPEWIKDSLVSRYRFPGRVVALDGLSGQEYWNVDLGDKTYWGYKGMDKGCLPDSFGNPSIGSDGTVYVSWSAGAQLAFRDANGDGRIDKHDPRETSMFHHGAGTNSQTAIAPGMLVSVSCDGFYGYLAPTAS